MPSCSTSSSSKTSLRRAVESASGEFGKWIVFSAYSSRQSAYSSRSASGSGSLTVSGSSRSASRIAPAMMREVRPSVCG